MPSASWCFFCLYFTLQKINTKRSPNATKLFGDFFYLEDTQGAKGAQGRKLVGPTRHQGAPGAPDSPCWGVEPMGTFSTDFRLYKYSKIPETLGESMKHFFYRRKFHNHEIQSRGLFLHSAGGVNNHGEVLHDPCCPSDDV